MFSFIRSLRKSWSSAFRSKGDEIRHFAPAVETLTVFGTAVVAVDVLGGIVSSLDGDGPGIDSVVWVLDESA